MIRIILSIFLFVFATVGFSQEKIILVIDPGHGGSDPGHLPEDTTKYMTEKELNLKVANYLGGYIEQYLQNVEVVYTRTNDSYPTLDDRVEKANTLKADYFISIHCNGNARNVVHGTETHVHSMGLKKSAELARAIETQFERRAGRHSRGVKDQHDLQHSLQVLKYTNMTSVLVECGFITNEYEASFLNSSNGQEIIASAIFRAFRGHIVDTHPSISFIRNETEPKNEVVIQSERKKPFAVQYMSSKAPIDLSKSNLDELGFEVQRIEVETESAYKYIYTVGVFDSPEEANDVLALVKQRGYSDAFVRKL
jgi:N-acetylmuramoyl-L-alanine amidase